MPPLNYSSMVTYAIKDNTKRPGSSISWLETIQVNSKPVSFRIDTGSEANLMSLEVFKSIKPKPKLMKTDASLSSYSGHSVSVLGATELKCRKNCKETAINFFITSVNSESVLGLQASIDLGIVASIPTPVEMHTAEKIIKLYLDVFDPPEIIRCAPYHINLQPSVKPSQAVTRKIDALLKISMEVELQKLVENDFLEPVKDAAAKWSLPFVATTQDDGSMKLYVDCRVLNKHVILQEHIPIPTIDDVLIYTKNCQYFSILHAPRGYTQIPLDEQSSTICTITTPSGKFKFKSLPHGFIGASRIFHSLALEIFDGMEGLIVFVDHFLVFGQTKDEHNSRLIQVMERARNYNLKFSRSSSQFIKTEIFLMGYVFSRNDFRVRVDAIKALPTPINKQELQRFLDMIGCVGHRMPNISLYVEPLKRLMNKSEKFIWNKEQDVAFCTLKTLLGEPPTLRFYNPHKSVQILVAASSHGVGAVVNQEGQPIGYFSSQFDSGELKYSQIEKKLLSLTKALENFQYFTYGGEVVVQSDHRPLLNVLKEPLHMMSARLQKIIIDLLNYSFTLEYVASKDLTIAYALSRNPINPPSDCHLQENTIIPFNSLLNISEERLSNFRKYLKEDGTLQLVVRYVKEGWPKYPSLIKSDAKKYFNKKDELLYTGQLLFHGNKLVVPQQGVEEVLKQLHSTHQSTTSCQQKAKLAYFWPSMLKDIETFIAECQVCQKYYKLLEFKKEEVSAPWCKLWASFVQVQRKDFAVLLDYFSKFLTIKPVNVKTAKSLIRVTEDTFATHGLPLEIVAENLTPFNSHEWKFFLKTLGIKQSNVGNNTEHYNMAAGLIKKSLNGEMGLFFALLEYNSMSQGNLPSPSELLMGRKLRSNLASSKSSNEASE